MILHQLLKILVGIAVIQLLQVLLLHKLLALEGVIMYVGEVYGLQALILAIQVALVQQ
jgi:hypothetical protein